VERTGGEKHGSGTVPELIAELDALSPGVGARLLEGDRLRSGLSIFVDGLVRREGLDFELAPSSEVHFIPAIAGGRRAAREHDWPASSK
jgi:molybdopterin converting factor small subunit